MDFYWIDFALQLFPWLTTFQTKTVPKNNISNKKNIDHDSFI